MDFKSFDAAFCREALLSYDAVIKGLEKSNLVALDDFYRNELPNLLHRQDPNPYITTDELSRLMEWKLARGKWRPRLLSFVSSLNDAVVRDSSGKVFASLPDVSKAVGELTVLKGVGPTTASAVLAAYAPDVASFMSDEYDRPWLGMQVATLGVVAVDELENIMLKFPDLSEGIIVEGAMIAAIGDAKDYSLKRYVVFVEKMQAKAEELSSSEDLFTPSDVERALWSCTIGAKLKNTSTKSDEVELDKKSKRKIKR